MLYALSTVVADYGRHMYDNDWGDGWWILMMVGMVVFWALVIAGIVWLVKSVGPGRGSDRESPLEILDRRFAEGAISEEEYQSRRRTIESRGSPG